MHVKRWTAASSTVKIRRPMTAYRLPTSLLTPSARADVLSLVLRELDQAVSDAWAILSVRAEAGQLQAASPDDLHAAWASYFLGTAQPPAAFARALQRLAALQLVERCAPAGQALVATRLTAGQWRRIDDLQAAMLQEALAERRARSRQPARPATGGSAHPPVRIRQNWAFALA
jgi:hypothetical protein